jgi:nucleoside-diphosphate-sugar epimerase
VSTTSLAGASILVTGAGGFIGSHICERLLELDVTVRALVREPARAAWLADQGIELVSGDLSDDSALRQAAAGCRAVIHTAAWTGTPDEPALGETVNVAGTEAVLAAAAAAGVERVLFFSSVAVYGINAAPVIDEAAATPLVGQAYPDSKIRAEAVVRRFASQGLGTVILRPASTYGPRGTAWTLNPLEQIRRGRLRLLGGGRGLINLGYIDNVVDGTLLALTQPQAIGQTYNLCDGVTITFREFYGYYARMLGKRRIPSVPGWVGHLAVSPAGRWLRRAAGRPDAGRWSLHYLQNQSRFSIDKLQHELGFRPYIAVGEGMKRTQVWLQAHGYLATSETEGK